MQDPILVKVVTVFEVPAACRARHRAGTARGYQDPRHRACGVMSCTVVNCHAWKAREVVRLLSGRCLFGGGTMLPCGPAFRQSRREGDLREEMAGWE